MHSNKSPTCHHTDTNTLVPTDLTKAGDHTRANHSALQGGERVNTTLLLIITLNDCKSAPTPLKWQERDTVVLITSSKMTQ